MENNWSYKTSAALKTESSTHKNPRSVRNGSIPLFSPAAFLDQLVRFIVADDQVSRGNLDLLYALIFFSVIPCN